MKSNTGSEVSELLFRRVYKEYFQQLYLYAKAILKSDDLAKDAVEEVFVHLWESGTDLTKIREIKSYLLVSVKNECFKLVHKTSLSCAFDDQEEALRRVERITPEEVIIEKELLELIDAVVKKLPDQCALVFDMARNRQMSYKEISAELGISVSAVGTQMGRAIHAIRTAIEDRYDSSDDRASWAMAVLVLLLIG